MDQNPFNPSDFDPSDDEDLDSFMQDPLAQAKMEEMNELQKEETTREVRRRLQSYYGWEEDELDVMCPTFEKLKEFYENSRKLTTTEYTEEAEDLDLPDAEDEGDVPEDTLEYVPEDVLTSVEAEHREQGALPSISGAAPSVASPSGSKSLKDGKPARKKSIHEILAENRKKDQKTEE
jgi:hypothetical protein